jgi:hypothetical protein
MRFFRNLILSQHRSRCRAHLRAGRPRSQLTALIVLTSLTACHHGIFNRVSGSGNRQKQKREVTSFNRRTLRVMTLMLREVFRITLVRKLWWVSIDPGLLVS